MDFLTGILNVWTAQWFTIFLFFGVTLLGTGIIVRWLGNSSPNHLSITEYFSLGISGSLLPVFLWALLAQLVMRVFGLVASIIISACLLLPGLFWGLKGMRTIKKLDALIAPFAILIGCLVVNLAFISQITFPSYFDSTEHYRIIKSLLEIHATDWPSAHYYHLGYHVILSAFTRLSGSGIVDQMLISGQIALSILPASLFFIVKRETTSQVAAFFTVLLGGFGWYMPAHAINWGKYPSIFGLICSIFVFNLLYLMLRENTTWLEKRRMIPLLLAGLITAGLIHTRSLIICGLFTIALLGANQWSTFGKKSGRFILGMFLFVLLACVIGLRNDLIFNSLISSYIKEDLPTLLLAGLLGSFSIWKFPKLSFSLLLFTSMSFASVYFPVPGVLGYQNLFLLDRPYVQILLHIPLSIISGLGFAGMLKTAASSQFASRFPVGSFIQTGVFGLLAINAIFYQVYSPSSCCQLAGRDDAAALSWIQRELPQDVILAIASQDLSFTPDQTRLAHTGMDAGIWITPITGRKTLLFSSDVNFTHKRPHRRLCNRGAEYIYVGNRPESFNESGLIKTPSWYQAVFILPNAKIYRLTNCP